MTPQKSREQRSSDFAQGILLILIKIRSKAMPQNDDFKAALDTIKRYLTPNQMGAIEESDLDEYKRIAQSILGERLDLEEVEEYMNEYGMNPDPSSQYKR